MKLKKILALAVVAMMALSSVASAAITQDTDGWYLQDTLPTKAAVSARAVSVTPAVEKIDLNTAKTFGITAGKGSSAKTDENTDFYKLTMTVNNIGELYNAYDISSDYATTWSVKMFNIAISIPGVGTNKQAVTSSTFEGKSWSIGGDGLQLTYGANSNEAYPAYAGEEGVYVNNPEVSVVAVYAVAKGYTIDVQPTVKVTYAINGTADSADADGVGTTNVVFAPASAPTYTEIPADTTQTQKVAAPAAKTYKDYDNNDVTLTKSYAIARFVTAIDPTKTYTLHAEATSGSKDFDMNFAGIEVSGTANFITIVKNALDGTVLTIREQ